MAVTGVVPRCVFATVAVLLHLCYDTYGVLFFSSYGESSCTPAIGQAVALGHRVASFLSPHSLADATVSSQPSYSMLESTKLRSSFPRTERSRWLLAACVAFV